MIIRKATLNDADLIATYLLLAMESIIYKFIGKEDYEEARTSTTSNNSLFFLLDQKETKNQA